MGPLCWPNGPMRIDFWLILCGIKRPRGEVITIQIVAGSPGSREKSLILEQYMARSYYKTVNILKNTHNELLQLAVPLNIWCEFKICITTLYRNDVLTHWCGEKMAATFQTTFSNSFSWIEMYAFLWIFHRGTNQQYIPLLVRIMAWCRIGDKPLSEPMMAWVSDAYMRHSASVS